MRGIGEECHNFIAVPKAPHESRAGCCLWLYFFNLIGNFQIDRKESERILGGVNRIEGTGSRKGFEYG